MISDDDGKFNNTLIFPPATAVATSLRNHVTHAVPDIQARMATVNGVTCNALTVANQRLFPLTSKPKSSEK
jgi:hypothetical protein